ncbi:MAG: prepilin-type N-terminal cleavage/methylation domain-containing protein [Alphaproteobacteria bacterium]
MENIVLNRKSERGFTLVELAIVMIIIGLLIGAILKGQELIANARVASTVAQVKGIDAATTTFRDKYDAFPGDMADAATRLPARCPAAACGDGGGDGNLEAAPFAAPAGDSLLFFPHLAAADLITGIAQDGSPGWGNIYQEAKISGGFHPGYTVGGGVVGANGNAPAGHYLSLVSAPAVIGANNAVTPNEAQRLDTKLDDGLGQTGVVFGGNAACTAGVNGSYAEDIQGKICDVALRFQN